MMGRKHIVKERERETATRGEVLFPGCLAGPPEPKLNDGRQILLFFACYGVVLQDPNRPPLDLLSKA